MQTIRTSVNSAPEASRFELLVRLVYTIPLAIVTYILMLLSGLGWLLNWGSILIRGRRSVRVSAFLNLAFDYLFKSSAYAFGTTDERPPIIPESG
jgi:hypothetical protein